MSKDINPKISPIANGTVLDHLPVGKAAIIMRLLKSEGDSTISVAINVDSTSKGKKDLVYIADRELTKDEIKEIGLVAPGSTINIIKDKTIVSKNGLTVPEEIAGVLKCPNPKCITNAETIRTVFSISKNSPLKAKCRYCEKEFGEDSIEELFV